MTPSREHAPQDALATFHPTLRRWFLDTFDAPTPAQVLAWPVISDGQHTLLLAPTGSGKTLAAFLVAIDRLMFPGRAERSARGDAAEHPPSQDGREAAVRDPGVRVLYISPLKALGVDVQRNLRSPLAGVRAAAERDGAAYHLPTVAVRSGDTPSEDRSRLRRQPPEILITTPESLYLMLTSRSREILRTVDTVIVDEIHSLVGTKRGAHLAISLERLDRLRRRGDSGARPLQRIGLSATQRPLDEVARFLGGAEAVADPEAAPVPRPVRVIEAGRGKQLDLTIEVPVEDMARLGEAEFPVGPAAAGPTIPSIWPAIHPRLVELVRSHRSTMIFVNSRRLAERLAAAVNETAGEEIALAHHGSIAKDTRQQIEDRLKRGQLPAIVATSSLELGIDMGAVDLVIQIEAPPSVASGIQRVGRGGHQVGARSSGVVFPKYRGDLLACAAAARRMMAGEVEATYYPRNPLDVLAQQLVAMAALESIGVDELFQTVRQAAPFLELPRSAFEGVLDLLAGRYPSDEFSELRPRLTWDRVAGSVAPRKGSQRVAVLNAGTIPDRGLYGVFLSGDEGPTSRVGELDEEMVFETHAGDVFLLGASSWRVLEITHDRVLVAPAPGEPGKMPFWRGDGPGRPLEFGQAIGQLSRELVELDRQQAHETLVREHGLDRRAAKNLLDYLHQQREATVEVPSDRTIVIECFFDEVGDWRIVILSPFGARVHAPWATAVAARLRAETAGEVDMMWTDDGMVFRLPESDEPPPVELLVPAAEDVEDLVVGQLGSTALFAARFRENAARALLLPRRHPGRRTPLWLQRRRSADLLAVAAHYPDFPILLETYRECLRDVFDLRGLKGILRDIEQRVIRVRMERTGIASPFASSLMFNYAANFLYEGDAPLAERRAQTLALDHAQLRELLGDAELRELLDPAAVDELALELQRLDQRYHVKHPDALHELLQYLGDLTRDELAARCVAGAASDGRLDDWIEGLVQARRVIRIRIAGQRRLAAAEDAARFRDALGVAPPPGLPDAFLESVADPLGDLVSRFARTHVPFRAEQVAERFGLGIAPVREALQRLLARNRLFEGEFLPGSHGREWCDAEVLRLLKRRSLAKLRKQIEPVEPAALARFLIQWQGISVTRRSLDGLLDAVQQLQGLPLPASVWERDVLPSRIQDYHASDLDELCAAGEIVWRGFDSLGAGDGRIALYLTDHLARLAPAATPVEGELAERIRQLFLQRGALFFDEILRNIGGFPNDLLDAIWQMVWTGELTNDTLAPLRSMLRSSGAGGRRESTHRRRRAFRSRRIARLPGSEGRFSRLPIAEPDQPSVTERQTAIAAQLIERYGVLTREMVAHEGIPGGFAGLYPILKAMEESGRLRRGYFVSGLGAAQFAAAGAEDRLRHTEHDPARAHSPVVLAATDPANPYGAVLDWPPTAEGGMRPQRAAGARVVLGDGHLIGYLGRTGQHLLVFLPEDEPQRTVHRDRLVQALVGMAASRPVYLTKIDNAAPGQSPLAAELVAAGFVPTSRGYQHRGIKAS
jgi:ATP-dependent helicase Lhr and Lhr-like helicase